MNRALFLLTTVFISAHVDASSEYYEEVREKVEKLKASGDLKAYYEISESFAPKLFRDVALHAQAMGVPFPRIFIIDTKKPFIAEAQRGAIGFNVDSSDEWNEATICHELGHLKHQHYEAKLQYSGYYKKIECMILLSALGLTHVCALKTMSALENRSASVARCLFWAYSTLAGVACCNLRNVFTAQFRRKMEFEADRAAAYSLETAQLMLADSKDRYETVGGSPPRIIDRLINLLQPVPLRADEYKQMQEMCAELAAQAA